MSAEWQRGMSLNPNRPPIVPVDELSTEPATPPEVPSSRLSGSRSLDELVAEKYAALNEARPSTEDARVAARVSAERALLAAKLRGLVEIQARAGNWDFSAYTRGMFNGMELMLAVAEDREPRYRDYPDGGYVVDRPSFNLSQERED